MLTFGASQHKVGLAAAAAGVAMLVIVIAGVAVHAPLARVPENTLKFAVGVMLTSFGMFWGAEGAGAHWPGSDAALLVIIPSRLGRPRLASQTRRHPARVATLAIGCDSAPRRPSPRVATIALSRLR